MIRKTKYNLLPAISILATLFLNIGCTGMQPLPVAARGGDTVALGIGTIRGLDRDDVTVTLIPDADPGNPIDLTPGVRAVFNLYPDPVSEAARYSVAADVGHTMQTMVVLNLPQILPAGMATIDITTALDPILPNIADQRIEILPGTGQPHDFNDAWNLVEQLDISSLEPLTHGIITVTVPGASPIAAAQFEVDFDETLVNGDDLQAVAVPLDILDLQITPSFYPNITWAHDGDRLRVQILCPNCSIPAYFFRVHVIYPPESPDPQLTLVNANAWDKDGVELTGISFQLATGK